MSLHQLMICRWTWYLFSNLSVRFARFRMSRTTVYHINVFVLCGILQKMVNQDGTQNASILTACSVELMDDFPLQKSKPFAVFVERVISKTLCRAYFWHTLHCVSIKTLPRAHKYIARALEMSHSFNFEKPPGYPSHSPKEGCANNTLDNICGWRGAGGDQKQAFEQVYVWQFFKTLQEPRLRATTRKNLVHC